VYLQYNNKKKWELNTYEFNLSHSLTLFLFAENLLCALGIRLGAEDPG
jgi:hypothetical protein